MGILYRVIIVLLVLAGAYCAYGIFHFKRADHIVQNPKAEFQIAGNTQGINSFIDFTSYYCTYCKQLKPAINELLEIRKDLRYVVRPIKFQIYEEIDGEMQPREDNVTKIVIAAGLQNKFWEMHDAVMEFPENQKVTEEFIEETANLYGIDYEQLVKDADSKEVKKIIENNQDAFAYAGINSAPSFMMNGRIFIVTNEKLPTLQDLLEFVTTSEIQ